MKLTFHVFHKRNKVHNSEGAHYLSLHYLGSHLNKVHDLAKTCVAALKPYFVNRLENLFIFRLRLSNGFQLLSILLASFNVLYLFLACTYGR